MTPEEFYESLPEKKPFTELTSTGISDNLPNVFEFAKMYAEAITVTRCCKSESEQLFCDTCKNKKVIVYWHETGMGVRPCENCKTK